MPYRYRSVSDEVALAGKRVIGGGLAKPGTLQATATRPHHRDSLQVSDWTPLRLFTKTSLLAQRFGRSQAGKNLRCPPPTTTLLSMSVDGANIGELCERAHSTPRFADTIPARNSGSPASGRSVSSPTSARATR